MSTPGFRDLHRRMQIFVLLYIEGGSYLDEEDPKWEFVVLFVMPFQGTTAAELLSVTKGARARTPLLATLACTASFTTRTRLAFVFRSALFCRPIKAAAMEPISTRSLTFGSLPDPRFPNWQVSTPSISVFKVLKDALLPVEDPSETFQDLRDKIDLGVLLAQEAVLSLPLDKEWVKETRQAMKLGEVRAARRPTGLGSRFLVAPILPTFRDGHPPQAWRWRSREQRVPLDGQGAHL
jgi:histone acetyltransferase 1